MSNEADSRFSQERMHAWQELDTILAQIERNKASRLADCDLIALPGLYRNAMSSLALAQTASVSESQRLYLEGLCRRGYLLIYGIDETLSGRAVHFFRRDLGDTTRGLLPEFLIALSLIILGFIAGWAEVARDPNIYSVLVPTSLAQGRDPSASTAFLRASLARTGDISRLAAFSTQLFSNNSQVAFLSVALGFFLCVPSALLMLYNGATLGAMMAVYANHGLAVDFAGWVSIHGVTELTAIALAGAAGLRIGRAFILPGRDSRLVSLRVQGQRVAPVIMCTVLMLLAAGLLEGVGRQTVVSTPLRFVIGLASLLFWAWCLFLRGKEGRSVEEAI